MPEYTIEDFKAIARWRDDPRTFVREALGATPDDWQDDVLAVVPFKLRVALIACKGPGKSTLLAWIILWWLATRVSAQIICTSISKDNLRDNLWKELSAWFNKSEFLQRFFLFRRERIESLEDPTGWWVSARGWAKDADPSSQKSALAGFHGPAVMYVGDEAGDYPAGILPAAEAVLANLTPGSGNEAKLVVAGNPTDPTGPLGEISSNPIDEPAEGESDDEAAERMHRAWHVVNISGDPDDPKRAPRVSKVWAREQIKQYGRNNPWVLVNVFGRFPPVGFNQLIGPDDVRAAQKRNPNPKDYERVQKRIGVDVARYGDDESVIFPRQGCVAYQPIVLRQASNPDIAARVIVLKVKWESEVEFVDGTGGFGGGVIDAMKQARVNPIDVQYSGKAQEPKFFNLRTEMYWRLAAHVKTTLALPEDPQLLKELVAARYSFQDGKIILEDKEHIKARLGFSPDRADALANTYALPDMPSRMFRTKGGRPSNLVTDVEVE